MKKFIILLIVAPLFFMGCENDCTDVVCDQGLAKEDINGLCFCDCIEGFTGEKCDQAIVDDPCEDITCENGGTCVDGACDCPDGFGGDNCETADPCFGIACVNGDFLITDGVCVCDCNDGFTGDDCSLEIITEVTGDWNATDLCDIFYYNQPIPYTPTIQENTMGSYEIINFAAIDTTRAFTATIENNIITVPLAEVTDAYGTLLVEGTGMFSETGETITWNYTTTDAYGAMDNCTGIWTKP